MKNRIKHIISYIAILTLAATCMAPGTFAATNKFAGAEVPDQYKTGYEVINCLDISRWQKEISAKDWKTIRDKGVSAVIVRAGYSSYDTEEHKKDIHFEENVENASAAGLDVGVYYFSAAINKEEAESEAEYFLELIEPYRDKITLPVVLDFESNERGRLNGRMLRTLGMEGCTEMCDAFLTKIAEAGYEPMIYANRATLDRYLDHEMLQEKYKIWLAQYSREGKAPTYEGDYYMWQYSSGVRLEGIDARVDANYLFKEDASAVADVVQVDFYIDEDWEEDENVEEFEEEIVDSEADDDNNPVSDDESGAENESADSEQVADQDDVTPVVKGQIVDNTQNVTVQKNKLVSFNVDNGVSFKVPANSDRKISKATVVDKTGKTHNYMIYQDSRADQIEAELATVFNGYFVSKHEIDPAFVTDTVLPKTLGEKKYAEAKDKGKTVSMKGIVKVLEKLKLDADYHKTIDKDVYVNIKAHLAQGKPVMAWIHTNNAKWGNNRNQVVLLIGMDKNGNAIMADPVNREWSESDQRIKLVSVTELVEYMKNGTDSDSEFAEGMDGGYILIDKK